MNGWKLTEHAKRRRKLMRVTEHQLEAVLESPDITYPAEDGVRTFFQRGHLVVLVEQESYTIVTVLYHRATGRDEDGLPVWFARIA